jgi:hypothetical protein
MQPAFAKQPCSLVKPLALAAGAALVAWVLYSGYMVNHASVPAALSGAGPIGFTLLWMGAAALYFLPTFVSTRKRNAGAIFALNLFLGWTVLGWVVALAWALTKGPQDPFAQREALARLTEQPGPGDGQPAATAQPERVREVTR